MYLAFFIISALDLLDAWETVAKDGERKDYVNWIYHCQHPDGGFRMWPGTDLGDLRNDENAKWDPANIPATYFALSSLVIIGDDLKRVNRKGTLKWLRRMQRNEGSFGETIVDGQINGGKDPRFGYCAAGIRHILRGHAKGSVPIGGEMVQDIDVDGLVGCIRRSESYDGGIADEPFHEPHAGYEYCALGALHFVDRLQTPEDQDNSVLRAPSDPSLTIRWLIERQTDLEEEEIDDEVLSAADSTEGPSNTTPAADTPISDALHQSPDKSTIMPDLQLENDISNFDLEPLEAGMNGRTNKVADTCYAWWAGASFHMMGHPELYDRDALQRYLLGKTQHTALGGFGKFPGDLPDLYHSYLGLAALGLSETEGIKRVCPAMCISKDAGSRLLELWKTWNEE